MSLQSGAYLANLSKSGKSNLVELPTEIEQKTKEGNVLFPWEI